MAIDYDLIARAGGFGKGTPRPALKAKKDRDAELALQRCYRKVDARDKLISWVSGRPLVKAEPGRAGNARFILERHHLVKRSLDKGDVANPDNVITVSRREHRILDLGMLVPVNKRGQVVQRASQIHHFEWNRMLVPVGSEPRDIRVLKRDVKRSA